MSNNIYYWACDNSETTGEGNLCLFFVKSLKKKNNLIRIKIPNIVLNNNFFSNNYILPFIGVLYCWKAFLSGKKVSYINYLPFWNFLIFLFLPPKTIIGPITGGAKYLKDTSYIRKYLFPIFYKISEIILNIRNYNIIFSTDLLKDFLKNETINKSKFNFITNHFKINRKINRKKTIDFIIYYRRHKNKEKFFPKSFIKKLISLNFSVYVVGDRLQINGVKNKGYINKIEINMMQKKSKFTISSNENLYSLFTLECIQNKVIILLDKDYNYDIKFFKKNFIKINYNNLTEIGKLKYYDKNIL